MAARKPASKAKGAGVGGKAAKRPTRRASAAQEAVLAPAPGVAHEPTPQTRAIVERAALTGKLTHDEIAALIGVSDVTLRKHYAGELANGKAKTTVAVLNSFIKNCVGDDKRPGDVNAQKFYLERFVGMKEQKEVSGPNGGPIQVQAVDLSGLDDDELEALDRLSGALAH